MRELLLNQAAGPRSFNTLNSEQQSKIGARSRGQKPHLGPSIASAAPSAMTKVNVRAPLREETKRN